MDKEWKIKFPSYKVMRLPKGTSHHNIPILCDLFWFRNISRKKTVIKIGVLDLNTRGSKMKVVGNLWQIIRF